MEHLPWFVAAAFSIVFLLAVWLFSKAAHFSKWPLTVILLFTVIQSVLGLAGFYDNPDSLTFRFPLLVFPLLIFGIFMFITRKGRDFIDSLDIATLTFMHVIRVGVELVLFWLYAQKTIPQAMTLEGRNFDILSGLTAPLVYYFGFVKGRLSRRVMVIWNIACILLLLNVVSSAFLSLPGRYLKFGFEQPNIAVGFFPFLLLPAIIVPLVLFSHAATIRQLVLNNQKK